MLRNHAFTPGPTRPPLRNGHISHLQQQPRAVVVVEVERRRHLVVVHLVVDVEVARVAVLISKLAVRPGLTRRPAGGSAAPALTRAPVTAAATAYRTLGGVSPGVVKLPTESRFLLKAPFFC